MDRLEWPDIWMAIAERLAEHRAQGRAHLLTEDTLRFTTALVLQEHGVPPDRLRVEVPSTAIAGGKLDLVIDPPAGTVIEFKFPRDSRSGISPDTMTIGELLRDFIRVASVPADDRWVVQILNDRLGRYVDAACGRYRLGWARNQGADLQLDADRLAALPNTATRAIGPVVRAVTGRCVVAAAVGEGLSLHAYQVEPAAVALGEVSGAIQIADISPLTNAIPPAGATRDGARREILQAARAVVARTGRREFEVQDIIEEMHRLHTGYADATIRTMLTSHLCAESTGEGVAGYADVTRVGRGLYRLTSSA
jgi:hypothetical protein